MASHTRSFSLPIRSHLFLQNAEEELIRLRACVGSSLTYKIMLDALKAVGHVYESINELLSMSSNLNGLSHMQHRRWVEQELEESVKLLDMCSTSRDNLDTIRYHVQDLELANRRGDLEAIKSKLRDYTLVVKKANRDVKIQMFNKNESSEGESLAVVSLLLDTREITISMLQSIFIYLSKKIVSKRVASGLLYRDWTRKEQFLAKLMLPF
ncbi:hypothetical protein LUZ62_061172 [Rhynchospora pubera]|uniref:Uncharacterized protein n=1 Tax=Rhynchospora pubera TaxID=906938 RepID=A0AAV8E621_9POAL|nr:hypothetical protein LUZ62_061172 [Rhynchospora pubera]